jgi:dTDP-6-deoxy-L-talose 4-dehydrogenase (NAD+)
MTLVSRGFRSDSSETGERLLALDIHDPPPDPYEALGRPDVLMHLAWGGLPNYASAHHFEQELPAHYLFLKALVAGGLANLVVTGTCLEYGLVAGSLDEEIEPAPVTSYGYAKDALRRQLGFLKERTPFQLTWARLFYLYGEGQAASSLLPQLEAAIDRGEPTFDMSGGDQLRDFMPVQQAAEHLVSLALLGKDIGIINVCSGSPLSVLDFVRTQITAHGWEIALNRGHYPYPDYEPMEFWGDRRKLDDCLRTVSEP